MTTTPADLPSVIFVGRNDWANFAHRIARALRAAGVRARVHNLVPHPYGYVEDTYTREEREAEERVGATWLVAIGDGSYDVYIRAINTIPHQFRAAIHVGSAYRSNAAVFNARDVQLNVRFQCMGADSLHLAQTAGIPAYPAWIAAESWAAPSDRVIDFLHCPSNASMKGTAAIVEACGKSLTRLEHVSPTVLLQHMADTNVYIDQINPAVGGIGCSAIEAAALGCAVITDGRHWPLHMPWSPPFLQVRSKNDLEAVLCRLRDPAVRRAAANSHHAWARTFASPSAVAAHWLQLFARHALT